MLLHQLLEHATYFKHIHFADLLSNYPLGCSLDSSSNESTTLFGVGKSLAMEDLEFPILLDKSIGKDSIVFERGPEDGREHDCELRRG